MVILTVVGARPQFVKAAAVSAVLRQRHQEILVHTGQHYDEELSASFFRELKLPEPDRNLAVGSGPHGAQTGQMLAGIEAAVLETRPDLVLVYGDTNSTLAGALAASKLRVPVAHVEAGCRCYERDMPEEVNRVLTDHLSELLFCPTGRAVRNLAKEGIEAGVHEVGDVMLDLLVRHNGMALPTAASSKGLSPGSYLLVTIHRPCNADCPDRLLAILAALSESRELVMFPIHPRTRVSIRNLGWSPPPSIHVTDPVGYGEMLGLIRHARLVLTDSGGVQKEAFLLGVPCLTLRERTEWIETVECGWNRLVGADRQAILDGIRSFAPAGDALRTPFGDGRAADRIVAVLDEWFASNQTRRRGRTES